MVKIDKDNVFAYIRDLNTSFERLVTLERQYNTTLRLFKNRKVVKLDELRELVQLLNQFNYIHLLQLPKVIKAIEDNLFINHDNAIKNLSYLLNKSYLLTVKAQEYREAHQRFYYSNAGFYLFIYKLNENFNVGVEFYDNRKKVIVRNKKEKGLTEQQILVLDELLRSHSETHVYRFLKDDKRYIDITEKAFVEFLNERGFNKSPNTRFAQRNTLNIPTKLIDDFDRITRDF